MQRRQVGDDCRDRPEVLAAHPPGIGAGRPGRRPAVRPRLRALDEQAGARTSHRRRLPVQQLGVLAGPAPRGGRTRITGAGLRRPGTGRAACRQRLYRRAGPPAVWDPTDRGLHIQLSETPGEPGAPAPELGETHRESLLALGLAPGEVDDLERRSIAGPARKSTG